MLRLLRRNLLQNLIHAAKSLTISTTTDPSLTVHFLVKSCGLPLAAAAAVAEKLRLKTTKNPHAVLDLLREYGFHQPQIALLVSRRPKVLVADPDKTLRPKLDFFLSLGLADIPGLISSSPNLLIGSLEHRMLPNLAILRSLLRSDEAVRAAVKKTRLLLVSDLRKDLLPKIDMLKEHAVPIPVILKLITMSPKCLLESPAWFVDRLKTIRSLGINPESSLFAHALAVFEKLPEQAWDRKIEAYRGLGWTEAEVMTAFARHPYCMSVSEENIREHVEFLEGELGWEREYLVGNPVVISLSIERRIRPRCAVLARLAEEGKVRKGVKARHLMMGEKLFRERFVEKFLPDVPEVVDAIEGKVKFAGFGEVVMKDQGRRRRS